MEYLVAGAVIIFILSSVGGYMYLINKVINVTERYEKLCKDFAMYRAVEDGKYMTARFVASTNMEKETPAEEEIVETTSVDKEIIQAG